MNHAYALAIKTFPERLIRMQTKEELYGGKRKKLLFPRSAAAELQSGDANLIVPESEIESRMQEPESPTAAPVNLRILLTHAKTHAHTYASMSDISPSSARP